MISESSHFTSSIDARSSFASGRSGISWKGLTSEEIVSNAHG
jgi:hypothetical protein